MKTTLPLDIQSQPSDSTCGPTCLQAIYGYWGHEKTVDEIIAEIPQLETGGTLSVQLACNALENNFDATIFTYNLNLFDPSWFKNPSIDLVDRLQRQQELKSGNSRIVHATDHYLNFLQLGGRVEMPMLERLMLNDHLTAKTPLLAGLSATYLYHESRERSQPPDAHNRTCIRDDIGGFPVGHFVVLSGYDDDGDAVMVSDPLHPNPKWPDRHYWASIDHVLAAIYLGIVTYDANLLVIRPKNSMTERT